jgi:large subunit ribosomal protein L24
MKNLKRKTYTNSPIKAIEKSDRIVLNEAWLKGRTNPRRNWDLKLGDNVIVIKGKDKGKTGKITKVLPREAKVIVGNTNLKKKHKKLPTEQEGEIKEEAYPIWIWNVMLVVSKDGQMIRTRIKKDKDGKRIAVKTGEQLD